MTMNFDPGPGAPEGPFMPDASAQDMDVIEIADGLFRSYAGDLHRLRLRIQAGETDDLKESGKLVRDLRGAAQLVLEERSKVDKLRKDAAGTVGAGTLDLAAARDEIGRRLACLRRAAGS
ncbi:MAG: permease [Paracoccus sp.]|nr:permease [Paracoccus sp. (in: a-proteobacteria)]